MVKALGGASTTLPTAELYEALKRGTVDGAMCYIGTVPARSLQEELKYLTKGYFASYAGSIYIRLDKWNSLSPDIRELLIESAKQFEKQMFEYTIPVWNKETWPVIRQAGIKEINLTEKEQEVFKKRVKSVWDWWKAQPPHGVGEEAIRLATE